MITPRPRSILPIIAADIALAPLASCNSLRSTAQDVQVRDATLKRAAAHAQARNERGGAQRQSERSSSGEPIEPDAD